MRSIALTAIALALLSGCYSFGQAPRFGQARVAPERVAPGTTALITVGMDDTYGIVHRVEGVVPVEPPVRIPLYDNGEHGDAEAGDGVWSYAVEVPDIAPPGSSEITFTAYTEDGLPVEVRTRDRRVVELQTALPFTIENPGER